MKLLEKKTIATQVATQRKNQFDEGILLAQKIDKLRATHSSLESQHNEYVANLQNQMKEQLQGLEDGIKAKKRELVLIEEDRQKLLEPFNTKWDEVNEEQKKLDTLREQLYEKRTFLTLYAQELDAKALSISREESKVEDTKKALKKQVEQVAQTSLEAQKTLLDARTIETDTLARLEAKKKEIKETEETVSIREREVTIREQRLVDEEQIITNTKLQLADQRATLERALARTPQV